VRILDCLHLALSRSKQAGGKALDRPARHHGFRELAFERDNHRQNVSLDDTERNR
jgi:hypothetical protein